MKTRKIRKSNKNVTESKSMKIPLLVLLVLLCCSLSTSTCPNFETDFLWGYYGVDFGSTDVPNIVFNSEDPDQINYAYTHGKRVFFYLEKLLFDFNATSNWMSLKSNWQAIFDTNYGSELGGMVNPFNIGGLTAQGPNGFFIGSQLEWFGVGLSQLDNVSNYIFSKYPSAVVMYDEHYELFKTGYDFHNQYHGTVWTAPYHVDYVSVSHFWPDHYPTVTQPYPDFQYMWFAWTDQIRPHLINSPRDSSEGETPQYMIWSIPIYAPDSGTYEESVCHPPEGAGCADVMHAWAKAYIVALCVDQGANCVDMGVDIEYYGFEQIRGLFVWRWNYDSSIVGYEKGLGSLPGLQDYEQYFGADVCTILSPASHISASVLAIIFVLLVALFS